jgi:hypothetical protein
MNPVFALFYVRWGNFKSSAFELSKILGKEDFGKKHEEWTEFGHRSICAATDPILFRRNDL